MKTTTEIVRQAAEIVLPEGEPFRELPNLHALVADTANSYPDDFVDMLVVDAGFDYPTAEQFAKAIARLS